MGKPMFNFGKNAKEKARQLKQTEKSAKRLQAKKLKAEMTKEPGRTEPKPEPEIKEVV